MKQDRRAWISLFASVAVGTLALSDRAHAQETAPVAGSKRVFEAADFARFAPKTAYDMIVQLPGFTLITTSTDRGLGQASENVLINGARIANKTGGAIDQLQRISAANVERIEIVDAASLGIAGLSGQVANVVLREEKASSGAFEWAPGFRAHFAKPKILAGSVSYTGETGPLDYTLSLTNSPGRGGFGGPIEIFDRNGVLTETRDEVFHSEYEQANMQVKLGYDGPGSSIGNLTLGYTPYWNPVSLTDRRLLVTCEERSRTNETELDGYYADINGDFEFALGPGRLKLIGLHHWEHEPLLITQVLRFDSSGADDEGSRFSRDSRLSETIARGEYGWKSGRSDWQLSFERAFNSLDQKGAFFVLEDDEFVEISYPQGTGKVTETRYEAIATFSRPLSSMLDLQLAAGAEVSTLDRVDDDQDARRFFRPKGSVTLGWRPSQGWDISLKLGRRVGQISFYDFLAQPKLADDRENAGNPNLVPPQSWEAETSIARDLGRWGKTLLNLHYHRVEDIIDVIPIGEDGEGIGNLPKANRFGISSTSTIQLEPIGFEGAKVDLTLGREWTSVADPLTGENRPISGVRDRWGSIQIRHDIPGTNWAWSSYLQHNHYAKNYFLTEVSRNLDLPWIAGFYIENKDVLGMTVRASVDNVLNGRHLVDRTVYLGYRDRTPIDYIDRRDQLIGPLFEFSVKGTF